LNYELNGLPLHILLVHAVIVMVPLAALCTAATLLWPAARRRLGVVTPILGVLSLGLVFLTRAAGQWLLLRVDVTPAIAAHAADGLTLLPWAWALLAASLASWAWHRLSLWPRLRMRLGATGAGIVTCLFGALVLAVCIGVTVDVAVIGEAGTRAVWGGLLG
jgi:hypothetical protein